MLPITWDLMLKSKDVKPFSFKWVHKVKTHADGSIERCKAYLAACCQFGLDYDA